MTDRRFLCYYEGQGDEWEAISVDYDIAVCGHSLDEAKCLLRSAILSYLEDVEQEDARARRRLLSRRMPWTQRLLWKLRIFMQQLRLKKRSPIDGRFDLTCPA